MKYNQVRNYVEYMYRDVMIHGVKEQRKSCHNIHQCKAIWVAYRMFTVTTEYKLLFAYFIFVEFTYESTRARAMCNNIKRTIKEINIELVTRVADCSW
jgi:hypothetical protein